MKSKYITDNFSKTQDIAVEFSKSLKKGDVLCLYGELGSGKTTFVQGLAKGLGIERRIISPTFIIARQYNNKDFVLNHIDLYRTRTKEDLLSIGLDEILSDPQSITVVEWGEKLGDLMPVKRYDLKFTYIDQDRRQIEIKSYGYSNK